MTDNVGFFDEPFSIQAFCSAVVERYSFEYIASCICKDVHNYLRPQCSGVSAFCCTHLQCCDLRQSLIAATY
jgi:hypothetical protein